MCVCICVCVFAYHLLASYHDLFFRLHFFCVIIINFVPRFRAVFLCSLNFNVFFFVFLFIFSTYFPILHSYSIFMHTFPLVSIPIFDILIFVLLFYPQHYFRVSYYRVINQKQSFSFLFCFTREKEVGTMPRSNDSETFLVFSFRQKYTTQN